MTLRQAQGEAWVDALRDECAVTSQARAAARIGYSAATVNQVLKGSYKGDLKAVQSAVEGALMAATILCPVLGELATNKCGEFQRRVFAPTNPQRVRVWRACRAGCPHSRIKSAAKAGRA